MSDLMDDLDQFVANATAATDENEEMRRMRKMNPVLPTQREEILRGTWCLTLGAGGIGGDLSDMHAVRVGYIFAEQDYVAISAITGEDYDSIKALAEENMANDMMYGRWYSEETPQGEVDSVYLGALLPLSEDQAEMIRMVDFRLPVVAAMTDWFQPLLESMMREYEETRAMGFVSRSCPECGKTLACLVHYSGTAVVQGFDASKENEERIQLAQVYRDSMDHIDHLHWICGSEECNYNEHVDITTTEVFLPQQIGETQD